MCDVVCDVTTELFRSRKEELSRPFGFRGSEKIEWGDFWFQKYSFWLELSLEFVGWNWMYRDFTRVLYEALFIISFFSISFFSADSKAVLGCSFPEECHKDFF